MALVALSYGLGVLHLGGNGWNLLGLITLIGALQSRAIGRTRVIFLVSSSPLDRSLFCSCRFPDTNAVRNVPVHWDVLSSGFVNDGEIGIAGK